jgi:hypothetical protein
MKILPSLLAAVLLVAALPAAADETPKRRFADSNFEWRLPSEDWQWQEVTPDQKTAGYQVGALRHTDGGAITAIVRVVPTNGLSLDELLEEVKGALQGNPFDKVTGTRKDKVRLSGLEGTLLVAQGTAGEKAVHQRIWSIAAGGKFHQVFVTCWMGAEGKAAAELDALRRGYRLLQGAGPEEPEPATGPALSDEEPTLEEGAAWPAGGPRREGNRLVFPSHNLEWAIPEGSPFRWTASTADETKFGVQVIAEARAPVVGDAPAGGGAPAPTENICRLTLQILEAGAGFTPRLWVESPDSQDELAKAFDRVDINKTKIVREIDIGNTSGVALQMAGAVKGGAIGFLRVYLVMVRGKVYVFEANMQGTKDADDAFREPLKALLAAARFPNLQEPVRGPLAISGIGALGKVRGFGAGEEREGTGPGYTTRKPKELSEINHDPQAVPTEFKFAWEWRSADEQHYFYFDLSSYKAADMQGSRVTEQDFVKTRESQWREHAGSSAVVTGKGKENWSKAEFARAKGIGYRFTGDLDGAPFVERGYIVRHKQSVYWVRLQFGGKDAEKALDKMAKAVEKALKFAS